MSELPLPASQPTSSNVQGNRLSHWAKIARRIRVPMGFLFALVFVVHLYFLPPTYKSVLLSLLLVVPGTALRAYASGYVKKNAELAVAGPYAYTRNPLYLGSMLMAFGFAAASRSWVILILLAALFAIIYVPTILSEEEFLRRTFPSFQSYAHHVPRLFPRFTPARFPVEATGATASDIDSNGFSPALYARHREYNAALGAVAIYAVLLGRIVFGQHRF
jgi:protein-S-isoprenylcysteine O-methyltransferase Ste14